MNLSEICIKRPVLATVLSLVLVVAGLIGMMYLSTRFLPEFEQNTIFISASYPGASAKLVETSVTTPMEEAISGVEGIDSTSSSSTSGSSMVTVYLKPGFDIDVIANKLRNKLSLNSYKLPPNLQPPTVQAGWGTMDLVDYGFIDKNNNLANLRDYLERFMVPRIQEIPGIANVMIWGANKYAMRVWLDPQKLAAHHLSVNDVNTAIQQNNIELPAGKIKTNELDYPITAQTKLNTAKQFGNIVLQNINNKAVKLKDVATVKLGQDEGDQSIANVNGQPGISLNTFNTTDANPITTANELVKTMQQLSLQLPSDIKMVPLFNQANFMKNSIHEVYIAIIFAVICVTFIIFLFLGRIRTAFIPIVTIPVCLLSTFGVMYLLGFSINIITLIALVLSIGLVVDDAIVMLENIHRHIEMGEKPFQAAIKGSKEITFSVIAMTLTLAAVYAPIGLIHAHVVSHIFMSFAFTLAGAVIISGFIALTLTPMMCARILKPHNQEGLSSGYQSRVELIFKKLDSTYQYLLDKILKHRWWIVTITIAIAVGGFFILKSIPLGFFPDEDMGFVSINVSTPAGSSLVYNEKQLQKIYHLLTPYQPLMISTASSASTSMTDNGANSMFINLVPFDQRTLSASTLATKLNAIFAKYPDLNAHALAPSFGRNTGYSLEFYILSNANYKNIYNTTQTLIKELQQYPGFTQVDTMMKFNSQQYDLTVNRDLAGNLGVNVEDIDNTINDMLGGNAVSTFDMGGNSYNVYVQAQDQYLHSLDSINDFYVKNRSGTLIPLSNLVHITPTLEQSVLTHYDRLRSALISINLAPDYKLGTAIQYLQSNLPKLLPHDVKFAFTGAAKRITENSSDIGLLFLLAIVFIYLVLSAQFESFLDPLIILLAVPLSIVSALGALKLINGSLNIYSMIGLVTLIGLIAKHGILITQFANKLQEKGLAMREALIKAATVRLRPILMTTAAMIFGALPLAFATGASMNSRRDIAAVIIAGLFFGTFFSLILVPTIYSFAHRFKRKQRHPTTLP